MSLVGYEKGGELKLEGTLYVDIPSTYSFHRRVMLHSEQENSWFRFKEKHSLIWSFLEECELFLRMQYMVLFLVLSLPFFLRTLMRSELREKYEVFCVVFSWKLRV